MIKSLLNIFYYDKIIIEFLIMIVIDSTILKIP